MYQSVIYVTATRHNSVKQTKNDTYIEFACFSCASLVVQKVSVSAMKVCNIPQKYLIFYISTSFIDIILPTAIWPWGFDSL